MRLVCGGEVGVGLVRGGWGVDGQEVLGGEHREVQLWE